MSKRCLMAQLTKMPEVHSQVQNDHDITAVLKIEYEPLKHCELPCKCMCTGRVMN